MRRELAGGPLFDGKLLLLRREGGPPSPGASRTKRQRKSGQHFSACAEGQRWGATLSPGGRVLSNSVDPTATVDILLRLCRLLRFTAGKTRFPPDCLSIGS